MMQDSSREQTLYDAIGGREAVLALVKDFYRRVLADEQLAPFFADVPMDKLRHMQFEFFSAALEGPVHYTGRPVIHAHQNLPIRRRHLQQFVTHLFETLADYPLSEQDRYDIVSRINLYTDELLGPGAGFSE